MAITPLPALDRTSSTFRSDVDAYFGSKIPQFSVEAEAARQEINAAASTASTAASTATTAAGTATTAAGTATTKAGEADTAKSAAQAAQAAAEAAYDNFDDRYLGAKASNPTTDNDGNALLTGALYFNTTAGEMRVWSGSVWKTAYIPADGYATTSDLAMKLDKAGGSLTGGINEFKGPDIASAATTMNIWAAAQGNVMTVTGTTATSGLPAAPQVGASRTLIAAGAWPLTHGANFILPGSANYTCAAGDIIEVTALTTTQFRLKITKANGRAVVEPSIPVVAAPGLVLLSTATVSSQVANIDFLNVFSSTYDNYLILIDGLTLTLQSPVRMQMAYAGSVVDASANYWNSAMGNSAGASTASVNMTGDLVPTGNGGRGASGCVTVLNANSTGAKHVLSDMQWQDGTGPNFGSQDWRCAYLLASAITGFRLYPPNGGAFAAGKVRVYGYANS